MSMRYAEISSPINATEIPELPTFSNALSSGREAFGFDEERAINRDEARVAAEDKKTLSAEDFDPEACTPDSLVGLAQ